jgi:23S rRNA pseudouridine2457 synthase
MKSNHTNHDTRIKPRASNHVHQTTQIKTHTSKDIMLIAFTKPFGVISQFTSDGSANRTLAEFGFPPDVYAIGRLDADSEGLLLLSDERPLVDRLLNPSRAHPREYWAQVEGIATERELERLRAGGLAIQDYRTKPCGAWIVPEADAARLPERVPPIRFRKNKPTTWLALELTEGKNRQVRRMTAAVGLPTLRLGRVRIGGFRLTESELTDWTLGSWRELTNAERALVLSASSKQ